MRYVHDGGFGAGGTSILFVDGVEADRAAIERTVPVIFSMSGETFDVGVDTGAPVGPYPHDYRFTGCDPGCHARTGRPTRRGDSVAHARGRVPGCASEPVTHTGQTD